MLQKTVFNCFSPDFIFLYIYAYLEKLGKTGGDFLPEKKKKGFEILPFQQFTSAYFSLYWKPISMELFLIFPRINPFPEAWLAKAKKSICS